MTEHQQVTPGALLRADEAIQTVLQAEQASHDALLQAQQQALQQLEAARAQARRIEQRTETRLRAVVAAFERRRAAHLAQRAEQARALAAQPEPTPAQWAALDAAVQALARRLAGCDSATAACPAARPGAPDGDAP